MAPYIRRPDCNVPNRIVACTMEVWFHCGAGRRCFWHTFLADVGCFTWWWYAPNTVAGAVCKLDMVNALHRFTVGTRRYLLPSQCWICNDRKRVSGKELFCERMQNALKTLKGIGVSYTGWIMICASCFAPWSWSDLWDRDEVIVHMQGYCNRCCRTSWNSRFLQCCKKRVPWLHVDYKLKI